MPPAIVKIPASAIMPTLKSILFNQQHRKNIYSIYLDDEYRYLLLHYVAKNDLSANMHSVNDTNVALYHA